MSGGGRWFGKGVLRNEDPKLLTGREIFIDDVDLPRMLHAAFVRSDLAHGIIESIDTAEALARDGVVAVYTAEDLGDYWQEGPVLVPPPPIAGHVFNAATIGGSKIFFPVRGSVSARIAARNDVSPSAAA